MSWNHAKDSVLVGLLGIGVMALVYMASSISELNTQVAVILERSEQQVDVNKDHEDRIRFLEKLPR